jgi:hypothetical protein
MQSLLVELKWDLGQISPDFTDLALSFSDLARPSECHACPLSDAPLVSNRLPLIPLMGRLLAEPRIDPENVRC